VSLVAFASSVASAQTAPPAAPDSPPPAAEGVAPIAPPAPDAPAPGTHDEQRPPPKVAQPPPQVEQPPPASPPSPEPPPETVAPARPARTGVSFAARASGAPASLSQDENAGVGEPVSRKTRGSELSLELGGAMQIGARFPEDSQRRNVEEAIDGALGLGAWFIPRSTWALGVAVEHIGLGKDHYATDSRGQTMNASYSTDTLWIGGRLYFSEERPAFYLGLAAGPALPRVRASGTRTSAAEFTVPPEPFQCSAAGGVGGAAAASAGVEFDLGDSWSFVSEARGSAHFFDKSSIDGCAPGSGPAVSGSLRIGIAYRFRI
jgi:hypothetical protein